MAKSKNGSESIQTDLPDLPILPGKDEHIPFRNLFYKCWYNFAYLFKNPFKRPKRELNLLEQVEVLINTGDPATVVDYCEKYIFLHRIVENTRARRRLERWITRLISVYLFIVFLLIGLSYALQWQTPIGVIITILSTTTINIVALGYILVRGLFHEHEENDIKKEKPKEDQK